MKAEGRASREFKGVWIPAEIWLDPELNLYEVALLTEIDSLSKLEAGCIASDEYFADFLGCGVRKVGTMLKKLIDLGYVERVGFDGRKRELMSIHASSAKFAEQTRKICRADPQNLQSRPAKFAEYKQQEQTTLTKTEKETSEKARRPAKKKDTVADNPPNLAEVLAHMELKLSYLKKEGVANQKISVNLDIVSRKFVNYYSPDWLKANGRPLENWKKAASTFVLSAVEDAHRKPDYSSNAKGQRPKRTSRKQREAVTGDEQPDLFEEAKP